jgi:acyl-CoA dehydrogenase
MLVGIDQSSVEGLNARADNDRAIVDTVVSLMRDFPDSYWAAQDEQHRFPQEFYDAFAAAGLIGAAIPEAYGGSGLGIVEAGTILREVAANGAALSGASAVHISMFGVQPVIRHGSEAMRAAALPAVVSGDLHVCMGFTEPDLGSDITGVRTTATRVAGGYRIDGHKTWITKADRADKCLLLTRTTPRERCKRATEGMTLFFVDMDRSKIEMREIRKMGRHAVASFELFISGLHAPEEDRIGEEGDGFRMLLDGINPERILVAYEALGIGRAAVEKAVGYAKERIVFGRPIGRNQGIQFPLADSHARLHAASLTTREAAELYDRHQPCGPQAALAKYLAADACFQATDRAMQTFGGFGYAAEFQIERYFREARLLRVTPVGENMILSYLAEHTLGLPKSY